MLTFYYLQEMCLSFVSILLLCLSVGFTIFFQKTLNIFPASFQIVYLYVALVNRIFPEFDFFDFTVCVQEAIDFVYQFFNWTTYTLSYCQNSLSADSHPKQKIISCQILIKFASIFNTQYFAPFLIILTNIQDNLNKRWFVSLL